MRSDPRQHATTARLPRRGSLGAVSVKMLLAGGGAIVGVVLLVWVLATSSLFARDPMVDASRTRPAKDSESGADFRQFRMPSDDAPPWKNPSTGRETLWPAELCYWTRDGKATLTPTLVILGQYLGQTGNTICPDCGREVVRHNPTPPVELMMQAAGQGT